MTTYTTREVAQRLLVTPDRVRKLAIHRKIGRMHGREWLFTDDDVAALSVKGLPGRRPRQHSTS